MPTYPDRSSSLVLDSLMPTRLSAVRCRLVTRVTLRQPPSSSSFVQLSDWRSLPHFRSPEISSPKPFVWFRAKTDKGIVCLADHLHSVTNDRPHSRQLSIQKVKSHSVIHENRVDQNWNTGRCFWQRRCYHFYVTVTRFRRDRVWRAQCTVF